MVLSDRRFCVCRCRIGPQCTNSDERVQNGDQLSHRGGDCDLFEFPFGEQSLIERLDWR